MPYETRSQGNQEREDRNQASGLGDISEIGLLADQIVSDDPTDRIADFRFGFY